MTRKQLESVLKQHNEKGVLTGQFKNAVPVIDREITACRIAAQACARLEFAFEQKPENVTPLVGARLGALLARNRLADAVAYGRTVRHLGRSAGEGPQRPPLQCRWFLLAPPVSPRVTRTGWRSGLWHRFERPRRRATFDAKLHGSVEAGQGPRPAAQREDFKQFLQEVEAANKKK